MVLAWDLVKLPFEKVWLGRLLPFSARKKNLKGLFPI
jgi:hypothetical protein